MPRLTPTQLATPVNQLTITTAQLANGLAVEAAYQAAASATTITFIESITLPALTGGRLPVCTGLARHPSGNGWLVGEDGRVPSGSTNDGGVIHYSEDFQTVLAHHKAIADWSLTNQHSVQGVAAIAGSGEYWALAREITGSVGYKVVRVNATTGAPIASFTVPNTSNGLAVSGTQFWVLQDSGGFTKYDMSTGTQVGSGVDLNSDTTNDHLFHTPARPTRFFVTRGANGSNGIISIFDVSGPTLLDNQNVPGATAIEGMCIHDGYLYICNDGNYHGGTVNAIRVYSLNDLLTR